MKKYILQIGLITIFNLIVTIIHAQNYRMLSNSYHQDSSIYAVTQIRESAFWMGGENGYIKEVNSQGDISDLNFSLQGMDVYRMIADEKAVYIVGSGPSLCIYNKESQTLKKFTFNKELKKRCFYDIILLPDNKIMLCGGNQAIAHAGKVIPIGFIAVCDRSNPEDSFKVLLKRKLKFTFTLESNPQTHELFASTFNGLHSSIFRSIDGGENWVKVYRVKGIIHDLQFDNEGKLWFAGTPNLNYQNNGMFGYIKDDEIHKITTNSGCLWKLCEIDETFYAASLNGSLMKISKNDMTYTVEKTSMQGALYTMANFANNSLIICGHGKSVCIRY